MDTPLYLECCDCGNPCRISLTLLTSDGRLVELASCEKCRDGVTLKCYKTLSPKAYAEARKRGLPVIGYRSQK